jgi:carboxypeptidase C (cathepsin A)
MTKLLAVVLGLVWACGPVMAQEKAAEGAAAKDKDGKDKDGKDKDGKDKKDEKKAPVVTHHEVTIGGKLIKYTATAGYLELPDYEGKPKANVFCVSYVKDVPEGEKVDWGTRPITYAFNGGPGSSSVWLHLGALGPRRVDFANPNEKPGEPSWPSPPYKVVDNEASWLDVTDLLFIDPVSTGYSRPIEGESAKQFHGLDEDIRAVGEVIRLWTTKNKRWDSPKFLAGESYGTTRAAGLSGYLQGTYGMYLNGIVLISPVLNFQTLEFDAGNELPYWLFLPTYTATAWYHGKLEAGLQRDLKATLSEVEAFAAGEYQAALAKGDALAAAEQDAVATKLARYTGLSKEFVVRARLRVTDDAFYKELLRDQGRTVGRLDSRYKGIDRNDIGSNAEYDASYAAIQGAFTAALNAYARGELNYENDLPYEILTGRVQPWSFASANNRYADVAGTLRRAMTTNPDLRVLVCSGYYDVATPYFAAAYTMSHMGLDAKVRPNIAQTFYECGHMMYIRYADLVKLKGDVAGFVEGSLKR